jgi:small-conductance mechanosensitive channel
MKQIILLLKFGVLVLLFFLRTGSMEFSSLIKNPKLRDGFEFYVETIISIAIFMLLLDFLQVFIVAYYRRRHKIIGTDNFILGISHIYSLLLVIGVMLGLLSLFRIDVREVFTSLSIIFAGLAILFKDYISNMINGMIITFSGQLDLNDSVRISTHRGRIIDITMQNVHLLNDDDDIIYIPNNVVMTSEVINYTKRVIKRTSIDFTIDLKYLSSVEVLEQELIASLKPYHDAIKPDSYYLRVVEMGKDSVVMKFQYILNQPNKTLERDIRKTANRRLVAIISNRGRFIGNLPDLDDLEGLA